MVKRFDIFNNSIDVVLTFAFGDNSTTASQYLQWRYKPLKHKPHDQSLSGTHPQTKRGSLTLY